MMTLDIGEVDSPTFAEVIEDCRLTIVAGEDDPSYIEACKILDDVVFLLLLINALSKSKEHKLQGPGGVCTQLGINQTQLKQRLAKMGMGVTIEYLKKYMQDMISESDLIREAGLDERSGKILTVPHQTMVIPTEGQFT